MADRQVDIAIIGAGTAGMGAYLEATKATCAVLVIAAMEAADHGRQPALFDVTTMSRASMGTP